MAKPCNTGLIGWPVEHSLSPVIHAYWRKLHGIPGEYKLFPIEPKNLEAGLEALHKEHVMGFNVTVPHKQAVMPLLHSVDAMAEEIGAVNTVRMDEGQFLGSNTDAYGFIANLRDAFDLTQHLSKVVVLGAGGGTRAAIVALQSAGAQHITIANRTAITAQDLAREFNLHMTEWKDRDAALGEASMLVNTTSLGMRNHPPLELSLDALPRDALVTDIVYAPLETELLKAAKARGNPVVDGLGMLLHQAAEAFRIWHGIKPEVTAELRAHIVAGMR